jgi:hypothetical protein
MRDRLPRVWALIAVLTFAAMTVESASAHDKGCDGNPVPERIKLAAAARPTTINRSPSIPPAPRR